MKFKLFKIEYDFVIFFFLYIIVLNSNEYLREFIGKF